MSFDDDELDEFIIQNFRSWHGKNYFPINCLNFLFGANSSGKSSLINAISLLQQSTMGNLSTLPQTLRGNGTAINLGRIENQFYGGLKNIIHGDSDYLELSEKVRGYVKRHRSNPRYGKRSNEDCFGFGYRCGSQTLENLIKQGIGLGYVPVPKIPGLIECLKGLELTGYYDPRVGNLMALEMVAGGQPLLKLEQLRGHEFLIEFGTNKKIWKKFHKNFFNSRKEDLVAMLRDNKYPSGFPHNFMRFFDNALTEAREVAYEYFQNLDLLMKFKRDTEVHNRGEVKWKTFA